MFPPFLSSSGLLSWKDAGFCPNVFSVPTEMIVWFLSWRPFMWCIAFIDLYMLTYPCTEANLIMVNDLIWWILSLCLSLRVCVCAHAGACGGQKLTLDAFFHLCFLRQCFSLNLELTNSLRLASLRNPPSSGITDRHTLPCLTFYIWGIIYKKLRSPQACSASTLPTEPPPPYSEVILNLVYKYFVENFCVYTHQGDGSVILFFVVVSLSSFGTIITFIRRV